MVLVQSSANPINYRVPKWGSKMEGLRNASANINNKTIFGLTVDCTQMNYVYPNRYRYYIIAPMFGNVSYIQ